MFVTCHELPWGESECVDRDWGMGIDRGEEFVEMSLDNPVENPINKAEDIFFERRYPSPFNEEEYPEEAEYLSLAQLAFTVSGIIPPRYNQEITQLQEQSMPWCSYCFTAFSHLVNK